MTAAASPGPGPRFGISMIPLGPGLADYAQLAERAGFDYLTCGEHLAFHGPVTNAFISLAAAAGATRTIGLISCVTLVPLYPPVLLAKLVATLDAVSEGRFCLGAGVGGEYPREFELAGIPLRERGARTDEALSLLRQLLTSAGPVDFAGRYTTVAAAELSPRPGPAAQGQEPGPGSSTTAAAARPGLWIAGRSRAAMRRAALLGDAWMPYLASPGQVAEGGRQIRALAARSESGGPGPGRPEPGPPDEVTWRGLLAPMIFMTADRDRDEAWSGLVRRLSRIYGRDFSGPARRYAVAGTPSDCRAGLARYVEAGAQVLLLRLLAPAPQMAGMTELVAQEVVGPLRDRFAAAGTR